MEEIYYPNKLGVCIICGNRILTSDKYLKATEGYCHNSCI